MNTLSLAAAIIWVIGFIISAASLRHKPNGKAYIGRPWQFVLGMVIFLGGVGITVALILSGKA